MTTIHRFVYYFQFLFLLAIISLLVFSSKIALMPVFCIFFFSELILVHQQTKMKQEAILYKKSCLFALGDLTAAFFYMVYFVVLFSELIIKKPLNYTCTPLIVLFSYTLVRKLYIFNNYTYEI